MKKLKFIIVLLFVGIIGCAPELTREDKLAIGFAQHPEWSEYHKQLIEQGIMETGMTVEQVELAWGWLLVWEWESGTSSYYIAKIWRKCPSGYHTRSGGCPFIYSLRFYKGKLDSWSRIINPDYIRDS